MQLSEIQTAAGAAIVVAILVQMLKDSLSERWIKPAALALGMIITVAATLTLGQSGAVDIGNALLTGFLAGASAVGLYQVQKPVGILGAKTDKS